MSLNKKPFVLFVVAALLLLAGVSYLSRKSADGVPLPPHGIYYTGIMRSKSDPNLCGDGIHAPFPCDPPGTPKKPLHVQGGGAVPSSTNTEQ